MGPDPGQHPGGRLDLVAGQVLGGAELLDQLLVVLEVGVGRHALARLPGPALLVGHGLVEAVVVDPAAGFGRDLLGHLEGEAVGVVQHERRAPVERAPAGHLGQGLVQQHRAGAQRLAEALLLPADDPADEVVGAGQLGVGAAHHVDHRVDEARHDRSLDTEQVGVADRSAQDAAQDVAPSLVGGEHAVVDQERRRAGVLDEDAQRDVAGGVTPVGDAGDRLGHLAQGDELVDVEHRVDVLEQDQDALEAGAGVDRRPGQRHPRTVRLLVVLHEDQVPELEVALFAAVGRAPGGAVGLALVEEDLAAGAARSRVARLPEVVLVQPLDALGRHADRVPPDLGRLVVARCAR